MGALPREAVSECLSGKGERLPNPIHSYALFPKGQNLKGVDNTKSFGPNSIFDYFYRKNFQWVNFGAELNSGFTIFHHLERLATVPYRQTIHFERTLSKGGVKSTVNYEYFARKEDKYEQNFGPAIEKLNDERIITTLTYSGRKICFGSVREISNSILKTLKTDPYFLIRN